MPLTIKENEILANHSTFRIGGPAKYFTAVKSKEELIEAFDFAGKKNLPFFVFGGGSNILYRDKGYGGLAIKIQNSKISLAKIIKAGAGTLFSQLIRESINANLTGLEWATGIPGTVGGAVAGNAGAYGHSISEFVKNVAILSNNGAAGWRIKNYPAQKCDFIYRGSRFKKPDNREIILEVEFNLEKGDLEKSKKIIQGILEERRNKLVSYPSAGCVFKNIIIDELKNKEEFLKLIPRNKIKGGKFPAGWLIENCGLKGKQIGGAKIAEEHANYIVNAGGATADDVIQLIDFCRQKTQEKFNLDLEKEIVVI
ncbi:MAG: UDP-N-acetylmuramate dehydrogenase [Candidatus Niyogibacteria bacterium]|nr:UDP-N-acetylmuramate dehydrogenase [Candidatus Niyogibacteria bacterium]